MISLNQLLESRDARAQHQKDLLGSFPGKSLLCLTVQLPGPEKRNEQSLAIAKAGVSAIRQAFQPDYEELRDLETGYEGYFLVSLPALDAKRKAVELEDNHPLGRLMDIDVLCLIPGVPEENYFSCSCSKNQFSSGDKEPEHLAKENYFSQGFAKNQFSSGRNDTENQADGNYFLCSCSKNQFPSGTNIIAISRADIGCAPRRCLLCENEVRYCMRAKTHTTSELLERIKQILKEYELQAS